ncbi:MAG: TetR family transcriptional regulator [Burkholderiales bacterium PBB4]|nr:MAG: TetR family transcriptional regulator [Burkholderiales bacterium PBB4]
MQDQAPPPKPAQVSEKPATRRVQKPAPKPYHHGNLRETLLAAAQAVLADRGALGLTLRDVAKAAGVSHAAPYHHFASLNDLLAVVAERAFITLGDALEKASAEPDTGERLLKINGTYVACARTQPAQFRLMFGPLLQRKAEHPALKAAAERAFGFVLAAACEHDPKNGPVLALTGWSLAHGLSNLLIDGALEDLPVKVETPEALARQVALRALGLPK